MTRRSDTHIKEGAPATTRRSFLWKFSWFLGAAIAAEYVVVALDFIRPRRARRSEEEAQLVVAGPVDRFEPGSVTPFPKGKFYLTRLEDGGFLAVSRECTHLGCTVPWNSERREFMCPCHASSFDITGRVLSPPAPRALDLHPVRIEAGTVKVDTGTRIRRRSFDPSQAVYA